MLAMSSVGLSKMEIARKVSIPYSTAFNLLNTMEAHGYVRKDEGPGKYYIGLKLLSLGSIPMRDIGFRDNAAPVLEELVKQLDLTAHLAILDRGEAVYIDKKEPSGFLKINSWIGKRNYAHTSAVGKHVEGARRVGQPGWARLADLAVPASAAREAVHLCMVLEVPAAPAADAHRA